MKKVKKEKKPTVKMVEYSIKMVIPTGQYANIQPEITVKASTPEKAHDYIAPHMNKMWKEYFMVNERVNMVKEEVMPEAKEYPVKLDPPMNTGPTSTYNSSPTSHMASPASNVALIKANQAIESCQSLEALELIKNQVELSIKLSPEEKPGLREKIAEKLNKLKEEISIITSHG